MERKMLIRNISYMERELADMKKELAQLDAKAEVLELRECRSKQLYQPDSQLRAMAMA
ncbi:hypothetical protein ACFL53_03170 [Pseudomonadota bacterium]